MNDTNRLQIVLAEGEGLTVEFKEDFSTKLNREIVAFANGIGGSIFLGIDDEANIRGVKITNALKSQIQDLARNCDPSIKVELVTLSGNILEVIVHEGMDKPYHCSDGFFVRIGANSQKLRRDEILNFVNQSSKVRFDETINSKFEYPRDFSKENFKTYLEKCEISVPSSVSIKDLLISFNVAEEVGKKIKLKNAAVLFFAKDPQKFFPESYLTCVRYKSQDRFSILDKKDFKGSPIDQIEKAITFIMDSVSVRTIYNAYAGLSPGQSAEVPDIPYIAIREAVINAIAHRDYNYDSSHIYIHMHPGYIEVENPGGLYHGLTIDNLQKRSVRRNRIIADLLGRGKKRYIEQVGSGFDKMHRSLEENQNPPLEVSATNFFNIRFYRRVEDEALLTLTGRQRKLYQFLNTKNNITKRDAALLLDVSEDTILRDLNVLIDKGLIVRKGTGKATFYEVL